MTTKRGRKPKYLHTIILNGINARDIYKKYKQYVKDDAENPTQHFTPIIEYSSKTGEQSTTQVTDLSTKHRPKNIFLDKEKDGKTVTMIDYINYGCLPERTDLRCFHDHHQFNTSPIGLPIKYVPRCPDRVQPEDDKVTGTNDHFLTVGVFCSFSCCLGYLKEHCHDPMFKNSKQLLYSLYYKLYKTELKVKAAPSCQVLQVYGGKNKMSIDEYRKNFCTCNYVITENIKRPYMVAVGKYIEERRCGYI